jgi:hypothetical protein
MKMIRNITICLAAILFSVPLVDGQDLSKYRNFSLGTSLTDLSKQVNEKSRDARVVHQSPALIQQLTWWPVQSYQSPAPSEPVEDIRFSFYNGELYRIGVTYENAATEGLTGDDMVQAISAKYGIATRPVADSNTPTGLSYSSSDIQIALWEDSQYSVTFSRSPLSNSFQLVMFSKRLNREAEAGIAAALRQEREDAPQKEIARVKKAADDLETARQKNLKTFRP